MREWIEEQAEDFPDWEIILFDGLDDALLGLTSSSEPKAVYSEEAIIQLLMADGASWEDAWDHYGFNIACLYAGPGTPIIVKTPEL